MLSPSENSSISQKVPRRLVLGGALITGSSASPTIAFAGDAHTAALNTSLELHPAQGTNYALDSTEHAYTHEQTGVVGILLGTPKWVTEELADTDRQHGQSAALVTAYISHGPALVDHLRGAYAFALINPADSTVLLGVDRMGRVPLYYRSSSDGCYFGTAAEIVNSMCPESTAISNQGLYNYIYFHMVPSPYPVFADMKKLQAGCMASFNTNAITVERYWLPTFSETTPPSRQALYQELKAQLKSAVANTLPRNEKVGAFLSGGLDSSTVTGMLSELSNGGCDAYSIGFAADGYDEMPFARITAKHFGARLHEYYVTPDDVVSALPLIASSYGEPFGNSSALPAYFCAKMAAKDGVTLLLAGDGGDELFAGNERYAKQKNFEAYAHLPLFFRNVIEPLVGLAPSWIPLSDKARSYIRQANIPLPDRLQNYNFLHQQRAEAVFRKEFLSAVDTTLPLAIQRNIYHAPDSASSLNRMLFQDWQITLADNDLQKVTQTCALAGVDVAYPMLDDQLVEFSLNIPSAWKLPGHKLRDFYKNALSGWLPEATLKKSKQGFGLPFGVWMREHKPLQDIAYDNITRLKSRKLFQDAFLDNAITMHRQGHAAYYGELIWILCVLELWMSSHLRTEERSAGRKI